MSCLIASIKEATRFIAKKGSRTRMIVAGILFIFASVVPMMAGTYALTIAANALVNVPSLAPIASAAWFEYAVVYSGAILLQIFISLPAMAMFVTYAQKVYSEAKYGYSDTKKRGAYNYFRSLFSAAFIFFRPIVVLVMVQGAFVLARELRAMLVTQFSIYLPTLLILIPLWCVVFVVAAWFMWVTNSLSLAPYYYSRGMSIFKSIRKSIKTTAKHPFYIDLFAIVFIALTAASMLTIGVLFVVWVLPLMIFTYYELADRMDSEKITEVKK